MQSKLLLLAGLAFAASLTTPVIADEPAPERADMGKTKTVYPLRHVEINNLQGDRLGRIRDVTVDLVHGRVVEVFVVSGGFLGMGGKVVSVPPTALITDDLNEVYFLNATPAVFKAAPEVDLSNRDTTGDNTRIAAAYRHFGREPYFTETGEPVVGADKLPRTTLSHSTSLTRLSGLPVWNLQGEQLGNVWSVSIDIAKANVRHVIVMAKDGYRAKSVIPARALRYDPSLNRLVLDDTAAEFAAEPQYEFTPATHGNMASSREEPYEGPHTNVALEQGTDARDTERTQLIKTGIRSAKIQNRTIQVGTLNGRVTLRGWVDTEAEKTQIGQIAINASRAEVVDNQIEIRPASAKH